MYQRKNWINPVKMKLRKFEEGDQILYNCVTQWGTKIPLEFVKEYPNYMLFRSVFGGWTIAIDKPTVWRYYNTKLDKKYKKSDSFEYFQSIGMSWGAV